MYKRRKLAPSAVHEEVQDDDGILSNLPDDSVVGTHFALMAIPVPRVVVLRN
jgi:hypothetical protein